MESTTSAVLYDDIAAALNAEAESDPQAADIPLLARLLTDAINGDVSAEFVRERIAATPALAYLLLTLAGHKVPVGDRVLSFGCGEDGSETAIARAPFGKVEQSTSIALTLTMVQGNNNTVINNMRDSLYIDRLIITTPTRPPDAQSIAAAQHLLIEMPTDTLPPPHALPPSSRMARRRNPLFVGREQELLALARMVKGDAETEPGGAAVIYSSEKVTASTGIGGMGKTQLANEFVHRFGRYFSGGVFWLSFAASELIPLEIADCGRGGRMGMRGDFHTLKLDEQVAAVRHAWQSEMPRLLVFDNCEDENLLNKWRPTTGGCRVLVTSRRGQWSLGLGVRTLPLSVLSRDNSIELLRKFRPDLRVDAPDLVAIATQLDGYPLALHLAGNYLAQYRFAITPAEYLSRLRGPPGSTVIDESLSIGDLSPTDHIQNVARTFALSYEQLNPHHRTDKAARLALMRARHMAPNEPIPYQLMQRALEPHDISFESRIHAADAFNRLSRLGLIEADSESGAFRLHGLLGQFIASVVGEVDDERERNAVEELMVKILINPKAIGFDDALIPLRIHLPFIVGQVFEYRMSAAEYDDAIHPQHMLDRYLMWWGAYSVSIERNEQALRTPLPDKSRVVSLLQVGQAYMHAGQVEVALERYEQALEIARNHLHDVDDETSVLSQIGQPLERLGRSDEAQAHYERGLELAESRRNRNMLAKTLINMSLSLDARGQVEEAFSLQSRAIALAREQAFPLMAPEVLPLALTNMASSLTRMGRLDEAIEILEHMLSSAQAEENHWHEAACLSNLGDTRARRGDDEAEVCLREAITFCREHEQMETLGNALHSCAETLIDRGCYDEALEFASEGLDLGKARRDRTMMADNATALCRLAIFQGALDDAAAAANIAIAVAPPRIAPYALTLAAIVARRRGSDAALGMFERAVGLCGALLAHDARNAEARDTLDVALYGAAHSKCYADRATLKNLLRRRSLSRSDRGSAQRTLRLLDAVDGV